MTRRAGLKGGSRPIRFALQPPPSTSPPSTCPDGWISCPAQEPEKVAPVWSNQILWCKPLPETLLKIKSYCYTKQCPNNATTTFITYLNKVCPAPANGAVSPRCVLPSPVEGESVGGGSMMVRDPKTGKMRLMGGPDTRQRARPPPPPLSKEQPTRPTQPAPQPLSKQQPTRPTQPAPQPLSKQQQAAVKAAKAAALRSELEQLEASTTCVRVKEAREIGNPPFPCPPPPGPETCEPFFPISEEQPEEVPAEEEVSAEEEVPAEEEEQGGGGRRRSQSRRSKKRRARSSRRRNRTRKI